MFKKILHNEIPSVLIVGGSSYVGSNICYELVKCNYNPIVLDTHYSKNIKRIEEIFGRAVKQHIFKNFEETLHHIFYYNHIKEVICVLYTTNSIENMQNILVLLNVMKEYMCTSLIVGMPPMHLYNDIPIIKDILKHFSTPIHTIILQYYNPIGYDVLFDESDGCELFHTMLHSELKVPIEDITYYNLHITDVVSAHMSALKNINKFTFEEFELSAEKYTLRDIINEVDKLLKEPVVYHLNSTTVDNQKPLNNAPIVSKLGWKQKIDLSKVCKSCIKKCYF